MGWYAIDPNPGILTIIMYLILHPRTAEWLDRLLNCLLDGNWANRANSESPSTYTALFVPTRIGYVLLRLYPLKRPRTGDGLPVDTPYQPHERLDQSPIPRRTPSSNPLRDLIDGNDVAPGLYPNPPCLPNYGIRHSDPNNECNGHPFEPLLATYCRGPTATIT